MTALEIPKTLLPADGRFGSGPSKVRPGALDALVAAAPHYLGTSHRRPTVKNVVANVRSGLQAMFQPPEGYEVVLGNGGSSAFWDIAIFCLIEKKSQHLRFGEFSERFYEYVSKSPHLDEPQGILSELGTHPEAVADADRRHVRAHAQRDVNGGGSAPSAAATCRRIGRRRPRPCRRDVRGGRYARRSLAVRRVLLRAAEVLRLGRRTVRRVRLSCRDRAGRQTEVRRTVGACLLGSHDRGRELPARPDDEHAGARDAVPSVGPDRLDQRSRRP